MEDEHNDPPKIAPIEVELVIATMETRLRDSILKIIRPSLEQVSETSAEVGLLTRKVQKHEAIIALAEKLNDVVRQQGELQEVHAEAFKAHKVRTMAFEAKTHDVLSSMKTQLQEREPTLDLMAADLQRQSQDAGRMWDEIARVEKLRENTTMQVSESVLNRIRRGEEACKELMYLVVELQGQREELMEELFGEGNLFPSLKGEVAQLQKTVEVLPDIDTRLSTACDDISGLKQKLGTCEDSLGGAQTQFVVYRNEIEVRFEQMREDMKRKSNQLLAHSAATMNDIRKDYVEEIEASKKALARVKTMSEKIEQFSNGIFQRMTEESKRTDSLHREIMASIDEVHEKRSHDRANVDKHIRELRQGDSTRKSENEVLRFNVDHLDRIVGLVLEVERVTNALAFQDFIDRSQEEWLCLPSRTGRPAQTPRSIEELQRRRSSEKVSRLTSSNKGQVVAVDFRQGVCSDSYRPGPVLLQDVAYERQDVLLLHHKLLQKAHAAYENVGRRAAEFGKQELFEAVGSGHPNESATYGQPGANGTTTSPARLALAGEKIYGGEKVQPQLGEQPQIEKFALERKDTTDEDAISSTAGRTASCYMAQRPGSQGQPQAIGSRGSASGSLGETELLASAPPSAQGSSPLKLPRVSGGDGFGVGGVVGERRLGSRVATVAATTTMLAPASVGGGGACVAHKSGGGNLPTIGNKCLSAR